MARGTFIEEGPAAEIIDNPRLERTKAFLTRLNR
jgi:polar amino acid transport system ATP-binding protein